MDYNEVKAGDVVNEFTGTRQRLSQNDQAWVISNAKKSLQNMINISTGQPVVQQQVHSHPMEIMD